MRIQPYTPSPARRCLLRQVCAALKVLAGGNSFQDVATFSGMSVTTAETSFHLFCENKCGGTLGHVGETPGWRRAEEGGGGLSEERISGGDGLDGLHSLQVGWWTVSGGTPQHRQGGIPFCRRGGDM